MQVLDTVETVSLCFSGPSTLETVLEISLPRTGEVIGERTPALAAVAEAAELPLAGGVTGIVDSRGRGVNCRKLPAGGGTGADALPGTWIRRGSEFLLAVLGAGGELVPVIAGTGGGHSGGGGTGGELVPDSVTADCAGGIPGRKGVATPPTPDRADKKPG